MPSGIGMRLAAANVALIGIALGAAWAISGSGVAMLIAGLAAAAAGGVISGSVLARSVRRITAAAGATGPGELVAQTGQQPGGELGDLAEAVNTLAARVRGQAEAADRERLRLTALLDGSIDGVIAVDADGTIVFANEAAARLLDRSPEELVGETLAWAMPNEEVAELIETSRAAGGREGAVIQRAGGQYLQVHCAPLTGGEGEVLVIVRDLTALRRAERVRRDFVANVSHELRTPVASIKSVVETLQGGALDDREAATEFLARAETEVDRLAAMVEELLELSRIESGEVPPTLEPVDVSAVVERAVERLRPQAARHRLEVGLDVAPGLPAVMGDAERLERAVLNLVQNAIKFTPDGGAVRVSAQREGGALTISVSDTGVGIAPDDSARVFERFYKADRSRGSHGTGLGLAVVKHTIEAHGGTVGVESTPGKGSTFRIAIPLQPERAAH